MALEMYIDAPNGDADKARIKLSFEERGYIVLNMQLRTLIPSTDQYFCVQVEEHDPFIQGRFEKTD
jgi:hypothetical protein